MINVCRLWANITQCGGSRDLEIIGLYCAVDSLSLSRTQADWEATEVNAVKT